MSSTRIVLGAPPREAASPRSALPRSHWRGGREPGGPGRPPRAVLTAALPQHTPSPSGVTGPARKQRNQGLERSFRFTSVGAAYLRFDLMCPARLSPPLFGGGRSAFRARRVVPARTADGLPATGVATERRAIAALAAGGTQNTKARGGGRSRERGASEAVGTCDARTRHPIESKLRAGHRGNGENAFWVEHRSNALEVTDEVWCRSEDVEEGNDGIEDAWPLGRLRGGSPGRSAKSSEAASQPRSAARSVTRQASGPRASRNPPRTTYPLMASSRRCAMPRAAASVACRRPGCERRKYSESVLSPEEPPGVRGVPLRAGGRRDAGLTPAQSSCLKTCRVVKGDPHFRVARFPPRPEGGRQRSRLTSRISARMPRTSYSSVHLG